MLPAHLAELCQEWRQEIFSDHQWERTDENPINPGEAGGYRVRSPGFSLTAYLKPLRICNEHEPRAANEKIVSDLGYDLELSVPPVLLYRRGDRLLNEENRCCVSLVMYPEHHEWGEIWNFSQFPRPVRLIIQDALSKYSKTFALDLLVGQTDRNNQRNVVLGADVASPPHTEFLFLDHALCLNYGNRWDNMGWKNIEMVPIPDTFRASLRNESVLQGADELAQLSDNSIRNIVERIPDDYMSPRHREIVIAGLNGRKRLIRDFIEEHLRE